MLMYCYTNIYVSYIQILYLFINYLIKKQYSVTIILYPAVDNLLNVFTLSTRNGC